ncbi:MAG: TAXI family TRAP transporter solute-binding subunit [Candidatus Bathyarchaeia archaeon]
MSRRAITKIQAAIAIIVVLAIIVAGAAYYYYAAAPPAVTITTPTVTTPTVTKPVVKTIRWGTSAAGTSGHRALVGITKILGEEMPDYSFSVFTTPGAVASMKGYAEGELEACYVADMTFQEMYTSTGRFEGFKPKRLPVQTFWAFTLETTLAIHASKAGVYKKWGDLAGKKIFDGPAAWDVRANLVRSLRALGIDFQHVEVDTKMVATALEKGDIEATIVYTTCRRSPAPWIKEMELATKIAILNPSPEEIEKLKAAGMQVVEVNPKDAYATDVGVKTIYACPFYYGFHVGTEVPEEDVYRMLKALEKRAKDLVAYDPGFEDLAKDFAGYQVKGILNTPGNIPIHPGLAKFLKEKGLWRSEWKVAA